MTEGASRMAEHESAYTSSPVLGWMLGPHYLSVAGLCARSGFRPGPCGVKIARPVLRNCFVQLDC